MQVARSFATNLVTVALLARLFVSDAVRPQLRAGASYGSFLEEYSHMFAETQSSVSHSQRQELFNARKEEAEYHNAQNKSWKMAINKFSALTTEELRSFLGYKRVGHHRWAQSSGSSFLQRDSYESAPESAPMGDTSKLASSINWSAKLNFSNFVHNQGGCGSCWAHAAVGAMEAHAELATGFTGKLSSDQLIECTDNPHHCGGTGGCQGATSELAFERARTFGVVLMHEWSKMKKNGGCLSQAPPAVRIAGFIRLAENKASILQHALATKGPVVVSVDAAPIFGYGSGVLSDFTKDCAPNHAMLATGYGVDGLDYWLVKNSWGPDWGEHGYARVQKHGDDEHCGTDNKPQEGVACDGGPKEIRVCGMLGITSDSSYPVILNTPYGRL